MIGRIIFIKKVHLSKWAKFIPKAVDIINKKRKIKNSLSFIQMYTNNNPIKYQYLGLPELPYIYEIGDLVALKALATPEGVEAKGHPGFKRSLGKHFWGNVGDILTLHISVGYDEERFLDSKDEERSKTQKRKIRARKWVVANGGRKNKFKAIQLYKVTGSHQWFPLSDIAPRLS